MKKIVVSFLVLCIFVSFSGFSLYASSNSVVKKENLARKAGCVYSWSGTWENNGQDAQDGDPGSKCFDGDLRSKWGSANRANGDQWVSVTFPNEVTVDAFAVWQDAGPWTNITKFKVQVKKSSDTWVDVYTSPEYTDKWDVAEVEFDSPQKITALRFYVSADDFGGKDAVELAELQVFSYTKINVADGAGNTNKTFDSATETLLSFEGATFMASSSDNENTQPEKIADGIIGDDAKWASSGNRTPQWIQVVLPKAVDLSGFELWIDYYWSDITAYKVEVFTTNGWVQVYEHSGSSIKDGDKVTFDTLWNTPAVRFTITEVGANAQGGHGTTSINIFELALYSANATGDSGNPPTADISFITPIFFVIILLGALVIQRRKLVD